jgi:AbrB family looped-hinge helix DNA binding protein
MEMTTERHLDAPGPVLGGVILFGMTYKVGPKGQVVIPKPIRDRLGISPGDEVMVEQEGRDVRIRLQADDVEARRKRIRALRGISADTPGLPGFEADKQEERKREQRRDRELEQVYRRSPR